MWATDEEFSTAAIAPAPLLLRANRWAGPVPFVGDPLEQRAWYVWLVWRDSYGRHVAGDSELVLDNPPVAPAP